MNKQQDWLTQLREKNQKMPVKNTNQDYHKTTHSLYLAWDDKNKKINQECRIQREA